MSVPPSADLRDRVSSIHGPQLAGRLISLRDSSGGVEVEGLVGKPEATRSSRESMIFIVNGRWVGSPLLARAIRDAYGDLLPPGRFPAAFVMVRIEPRLLDANVHPSKREVRFSGKVPVYDVVRGAAVAALSAHAPELWPASEGAGAAGPAVAPARQQRLGLDAGEGSPGGPAQGEGGAGVRRLYAVDFDKVMDAYRGDEAATGERVAVNLWQLHGSYVVGQTKNGMVIIDQHAAHERILYEAARESMRTGGGSSQQLLFPLVMDLSPSEYDTLLEILPFLGKLGFDVRSMSRRSVVVYGIPALAREWRDGELLRDIIEEYAATGSAGEDRFEEVAKSFACHAAIKAGQPQSLEEMNALVDDLFATSVPHGDPHGRPTYLQISLSELERRFGRS